ncbi:MAG: hypothetical protein K8T25_05450 [Planctomycetia bacterium]|nr:hypothetical protein [Planctomycetia bacterium]
MSSSGTGMFPVQRGLFDTSRIRPLTRAATSIQATEWTTLMLCGVAAAMATHLLKPGLLLPGHAILRSLFPMLCGMSLVPRRGSGTIMGLFALPTMGAMQLGGFEPSPGSFTSLMVIGPLLDLAVVAARPGWRVWLRFGAAGLVANMLALGMRLIAAATGLRPLGNAGAGHGMGGGMGTGGGMGMGTGGGMGMGGGGGMGHGAGMAGGATLGMVMSYVACGLAAGLLSAMIWFRFGPRRNINSPVIEPSERPDADGSVAKQHEAATR